MVITEDERKRDGGKEYVAAAVYMHGEIRGGTCE
jgi:hypothetical protein